VPLPDAEVFLAVDAPRVALRTCFEAWVLQEALQDRLAGVGVALVHDQQLEIGSRAVRMLSAQPPI
jgi:hypothetical protein